ncbi:MAG: hypothetical protein A3J29_20820 [Acidobacteria bacterium RIFCSPLOWO2_12_FULL_67_14b]|nr:MAG: hypothetical protein A3J29_20820 [Acidobacteria bacterium RIFCSPLOWO2_12_FULL_67_14b]
MPARWPRPAFSRRRLVRLNISSDGSHAITAIPARARNSVSAPVPHPISSTRQPGASHLVNAACVWRR